MTEKKKKKKETNTEQQLNSKIDQYVLFYDEFWDGINSKLREICAIYFLSYENIVAIFKERRSR